MNILFLVEERSTKELLDILLKRIIPPEIEYLVLPHEGKSDLQKSIPIKLAGWNKPDTRFVIIHDQDSADCKVLKAELNKLCKGKEALIRIACHEMEAWYFGDLKAVFQAYGKDDYTKYALKRKYRNPDAIVSAKQELRRLIPEHQQIDGARRIAPYMDIENNTSHSFNVLIEGIRKLIEP